MGQFSLRDKWNNTNLSKYQTIQIYQNIKMQNFLKIALCITISACAVTCNEEGEERLGYYSVASDGTTSLSFNSTSIQNLVILGLFGLALGALFGAEEAADTGYGYGYEQPAYGQGAYGNFAKRHGMDFVAPVLSALTKGKKKYEEEEEQ